MTAAAARKLQKDIDVVLKKVDDGIDEFGSVWEQATSSSNNSQKEKLGEDLKRSINKLQRFRAQIREWISQGEVKGNTKDKLEDARKRIESDMQRFKEFERDLKTKAFSTWGLAKTDDLEIEEAEKLKYQEWLMSTIQGLNDQLDEFEADLEQLESKKSLSADDKSRSAQLKIYQERHRWHVKKLELVLRAVDNDNIDITDLPIVRESLEVYIDMHQDDDFVHDEGLYDCFDLTEFEDKGRQPPTPSTAEASKDPATPSGSKEEPAKKGKEKEKRKKADEKRDKKREEREKKAAAAAAASPANGGGTSKGSQANGSDSRSTPKHGEEIRLLDDIDLNEVKVQEDQLLSEAEEFICKICQIHVVGCSPKLTNCSHLFCGDCIAQWFNQHPQSQTWAQRAKSAGPERIVPCPVCKQPLNEKKDLYPVYGATSRSENLLLWRMLSSLKIMCVNHHKILKDGTCDWVGEYGQYQKHITSCRPDGNASAAGASQEAKSEPCDASPAERTPTADRGQADRSAPAERPVPSERPTDRAAAAERSAMADAQRAAATAAASAERERAAAEQQRANAEREARERAAEQQRAAAAAAAEAAARSPAAARSGGTPKSASTPKSHAETSPKSAPAPSPVGRPQLTQSSGPRLGGPSPAEGPSMAGHRLGGPSASEAPPVAPSSPAAPAKASAAPTVAAPSPSGREASRSAVEAKESTASKATSEAEGTDVAQATSVFEPTGPNMVQIQPGHSIQILERHASGWTYCKNQATGGTGWAPSWVCQATPPPTAQAGPQTSPQAGGAAGDFAGTGASQEADEPSRSHSAAHGKDALRPSPQSQTAVAAAPTPQQAAPKTPQPQLQQTEAPAPSTPKAPHMEVRAAQTSFTATSASQLSLCVNDLVEIIERHSSGWTYGRKVSASTQSNDHPLEGWFPDWVSGQQ